MKRLPVSSDASAKEVRESTGLTPTGWDVYLITSDIAKRLWRDDITYISQLNDGMMEVCLRQANQRLGEQGYSDVTDSEFRWRMNRALTNLRIEESKNKSAAAQGSVPLAATNTTLIANDPPRRLPYDPTRD